MRSGESTKNDANEYESVANGPRSVNALETPCSRLALFETPIK
jgi:hypothetical protein